MKILLALFLALLVGINATSPPTPTEPPPEPEAASTKVRCSAFAALTIRVTGTGRCKGIAGADCKAIASAQDDFKEAYNAWWGEGGGCQTVKLEEAARAVANASAAVYAKTIAKVTCVGQGGYACGWAISEGSSFAQAMARAVAQAAVDASSLTADAFCIADVAAITGAVAEAAASSQSKACIKGTGSEEDFQEGFVESLAQAVAEAFVKATASTCDKKGVAASQSKCYGEAGGDTKGSVKTKTTEKAKARGSTSSIEECAAGMDECCKKSYKQIRCKCKKEGCKGTWYKSKDFSEKFTRTWRKPGPGAPVCQCKRPVT